MSTEALLSFEQALRLLADERASVSSAALYALSGPSRTNVQSFARQWELLSSGRKRQVIDVLVASAETNSELDFAALFRVTLQDGDEEIRRLSIEGLWEEERPSLIAPLVALLRRDEAMSVRAAAATSLGRFVLLGELGELSERHVRATRSVLMETIDDPDEHVEVRRRAVESVSYWDELCVREIISAAYADDHEAMQHSAVFSMGRSANPIWSNDVLEELLNDNAAMRFEAARASGELGIAEAVPTLVHHVSGPDVEVKLAAIAALGQIGGKHAREVLERCCRSEDEATRLAAEDGLAELALEEQPLDLWTYDPPSEGKGSPTKG